MKLNVVHLSTYDILGGAAIAAYRIHNALLKSGINSKILVQSKLSNDSTVISSVNSSLDVMKYHIRRIGDKLVYKTLCRKSWYAFTIPYFGLDISNNELIKKADIINVHQTNNGFLSLKSLSKLAELKKPVFFTLHDMWALTAGCHYNNGCENFLEECGNCPLLRIKGENDISRKIHHQKKAVYKKLNPNIITCSNWMNSEAKRSSLLRENRIRTIHYPVNAEIFKPVDKESARAELGLPNGKFLILAGAMDLNDERKGFKHLISALKVIDEQYGDIKQRINIVVFGTIDEKVIGEIPFKVHQLGRISGEEKIALCYNSADIYVTTALQDNLPNTVVESLSCGTPVVAFNTGGLPDMVEHMRTGYLAELKSATDFAKGIITILSDSELLDKMKTNCRQTALKKFNEETVANQYLEYYREVLPD